MAACTVNLEYRLRHTLDLGAHTPIVGEVIQTHVNESCLTDGKPEASKVDPLVYSPGTRNYHRLEEVVGMAFSIGKNERGKK